MSNLPTDFTDADATRFTQPRGPLPVAPAAIVEMQEIKKLAAANPLLAAANPLLMMLQTLRTATAPGDVVDLRNRLIALIRDFEAACEKAGVPTIECNIANYAMCTVVDECVQMTPWGGSSNWAQQSLLIHFHQENWGGEKFFDILNRLAASPAKYQALLELMYVCLALGFTGRFGVRGPEGRQSLIELRERVFQLIRQGRSNADATLSSRWKGVAIKPMRFTSLGFTALFCGLCLLITLCCFAFYFLSLSSDLAALDLDRLTMKAPVATKAALVAPPRPRLRVLLKDEIDAHRMDVVDAKFESTVTFDGENSQNLFASGSVVVSDSAREEIDKVADALKQLQGNVVVTGHTDDVKPARFFPFPTNSALSRERARVVAQILGTRLGDPARVTYEGRGDSEPLLPKANEPLEQVRARNRRVEIVLKAQDGNN